MAYSIKAVRDDGNQGSNIWYKGSGGLSTNYGSGEQSKCLGDTGSGWTSVYADRKMFDTTPSEWDLDRICNQIPKSCAGLYPVGNSSLVFTVVSE